MTRDNTSYGISDKQIVTSGISQLDAMLGGGILIGDNVVWYDDAGSLAHIFCLNLIKVSQNQKKSTIYVSFDRSPKNLLEKLGPLAKNRYLTILDCFSFGKGEGADVFLKFYKEPSPKQGCHIFKVDDPKNPDNVMDAVYKLHKSMKDDVRLVFESLTGMQELWGEEDHILNFYSRSCPRLYELNTIAYWIVEKAVHSQKLKAHLNKITQVAIDLSLKRGKTSITILKAEKREIDLLDKPSVYWNKGIDVHFDSEKKSTGRLELGFRIKELRTQARLSQSALAKFIGVTPSTISQVENNQIYPSLPALIKIAEILKISASSLFKETETVTEPVRFSESDRVEVQFAGLPKDAIFSQRLTPNGFESKIEPYVITFPPESKTPSHFFSHKGDEGGYLLSGELRLHLETGLQAAKKGDWIYLTDQTPLYWENPGPEPARLLWMKIRP
ncbi:MAG: helix-turn-helix domain-containing protein [Proteobacteria bacterium]|nr:helix-turn-helix domain-containing protein [Pseudomonadota bacterium]MBU4470620.1 helix-turn-helix domain-containing protein [Pseudomonadota bacterium]MCG2753345.1 helix-turn-helix domain-containing protein [Desulfobacteraceae bacterium]